MISIEQLNALLATATFTQSGEVSLTQENLQGMQTLWKLLPSLRQALKDKDAEIVKQNKELEILREFVEDIRALDVYASLIQSQLNPREHILDLQNVWRTKRDALITQLDGKLKDTA